MNANARNSKLKILEIGDIMVMRGSGSVDLPIILCNKCGKPLKLNQTKEWIDVRGIWLCECGKEEDECDCK